MNEEKEPEALVRSDPRWKLQQVVESVPDDVLDEVGEHTDAMMAILCARLGHTPQVDQCGMPAHDFCTWCNARTPGAAPRVKR